MYLCMRTTVDLPDNLVKRIKARTAEKNVTFRSLVIAALEKELAEKSGSFQLRDASVGACKKLPVSNETINRYLDASRDFNFRP